jgi:hypothetical protein
MSNPNPYDQLGVTQTSSFEEIQDARNRLFAEHKGDHKQLELIEAAYDAVLMDRLRLRQEGKIKVPDRIRFAEKVVQPPPSPSPIAINQSPEWLKRLIDKPSALDIWLPFGILASLSALVCLVAYQGNSNISSMLQLTLVLGVGTSLYFLFRKERKLGRTVLLGFGGLFLGFTIGAFLSTALHTLPIPFEVRPDVFATVVTFFILWLITSFLR